MQTSYNHSPQYACRRELEAASMQQLIQQLGDSPSKPARAPPSLHPSTSPRQQYSALRDTLMRGNPLYGEHRGQVMRTPDSMLGSHTASNEVHAASASATMKSVSGRPVSNPLFETQDTQSRHEVCLTTGRTTGLQHTCHVSRAWPSRASHSRSAPAECHEPGR